MSIKGFLQKRFRDSESIYLLTIYLLLFSFKSPYVDFFHVLKNFANLRRIGRCSQVKISTTGVLIVINDDAVFKLPLSELSSGDLDSAWRNYSALRGEDSLSKFVDYEMCRWYSGFCMERLTPISLAEYEEALHFFSPMWVEKERVSALSLQSTLFVNIETISKLCGMDIRVPDYMVDTSLMHGDLTAFNIMRNSSGNYVLIDLDRFSFKGISFVDQLHSIVSSRAAGSKNLWFDDVKEVVLCGYDSRKAYLYVLFRVSSEYRRGITLGAAYYEGVKRVISQLVDE